VRREGKRRDEEERRGEGAGQSQSSPCRSPCWKQRRGADDLNPERHILKMPVLLLYSTVLQCTVSRRAHHPPPWPPVGAKFAHKMPGRHHVA